MARTKYDDNFKSPVTAKMATRSKDSHLIQVKIIPFEEEYYDVINNPEMIWERYEEKMIRIVNKLANWKGFNKEDLFQQAYLYFIYFSEQYDPYWNDGFIPFDRYLFKNMIIKLRAFIQRFYTKRKREHPVEILDFGNAETSDNEEIVSHEIDYTDSKIYSDYICSRISLKQRQILELTLQGYKSKYHN